MTTAELLEYRNKVVKGRSLLRSGSLPRFIDFLIEIDDELLEGLLTEVKSK
jgi:hypothetical protein